MTLVIVSAVTDFSALGERWRDLENRADVSFFQSWTWTGCLAAERFPNPVLVEASEQGRTVALALFNRSRRWHGSVLHLGETGDPARDCPYIEHNGVLAEKGREGELSRACLRALAHPVVMSGVGDTALAALRDTGWGVIVSRTQPAPFANLIAARETAGDVLARRGANTRQQVRRSDRAFAALGPLSVQRAASADQAHAWLEDMALLHQTTWQARGEPGCFAEPFFGRFHHALIDRGMGRGEIDLLRVFAGTAIVGILYNFRHRGRMLAYQSGFDYGLADNRRKPGMTSHHLAMRFALEAGLDVYDFLAGDDRYKRVLSDEPVTLHWATAAPISSVMGWRGLMVAGLKRFWR